MHRFILSILMSALPGLALLFASPGTLRGQERADHEHGEHDAAERHLSHDHGGFPGFVDVFFTHHAYLERKLHPSVAATLADLANEFEESAELAWQFNPWLGGEVEVPLIQSDPDEGDGSSGLGDVEVAPMVALYRSPARLAIVTARSGFVLPTGDEEVGLGADGWAWEPALLLWKGYGTEKRGAFQAEVAYERLFAHDAPDEEVLVHNLAWSHWLPNNWIPIAELNGVTRLSGGGPADHHEEDALARTHTRGLTPAHGGAVEAEEDTVVAGTLGFRYAFSNGQQWGAAVRLPLTDTEAYDWRLVIGGIIHLD